LRTLANWLAAVRRLHEDGAVRTGATFRLFGDHGGSAAAVTRLLGVEPSSAAEAGDRVGRFSRAFRDVSLWRLSSDLPADSELADHLHWLLDHLESKSAEVWRLVDQGYDADWFCLAASHAAEHAVALDHALLSRLLRLPGDLFLDVQGDDLDD